MVSRRLGSVKSLASRVPRANLPRVPANSFHSLPQSPYSTFIDVFIRVFIHHTYRVTVIYEPLEHSGPFTLDSHYISRAVYRKHSILLPASLKPMTSLFPHAAFAEDQPHARSILRLHVGRAGFFVGSLGGVLTASIAHFFPTSLIPSRFRSPSSSPDVAPLKFSTRLLRHAGFGGFLFIGILEIATALKMKGREEIEWQDRAWRLQENRSQVDMDWWTIGGGIAGGAIATIRGARVGQAMSRWRAMAGGTAVGGVLGMVAYSSQNRSAWRKNAEAVKGELQS